jgi:protochlorophyllide reductase
MSQTKASYTENYYPDLKGKVYIVTGGVTGIGYHVSKLLLEKHAKVLVAARNEKKIQEGVEKLKKEVLNTDIDYFKLDVGDLQTIKPGVQKFLNQEARLDGVVHNAGVMMPPAGSKTKQGYEEHVGVNNIGPHLLQKFLDGIIIKTAKSSPENSVRVIWVSSAMAYIAPPTGVNWNDINYEKDRASQSTKYGQSKAINIYQAIMWPKMHPESGIVNLSVHPGGLKTELQRHSPAFMRRIANMFLYEPINGAYSELFGLMHPQFTTKENGTYLTAFGAVGQARSDQIKAANGPEGEKMWKWLDEQVSEYL